jgi:hypothetical protein
VLKSPHLRVGENDGGIAAMRKRASKVKAGRKGQRKIADSRIEIMTQLAIETAKKHNEPFRNPVWQGSKKLYPLKYVRKHLKKVLTATP